MPGTESNNLVIWGEELGTSSPGGKGDGVIGYDTPHADRIAGDARPRSGRAGAPNPQREHLTPAQAKNGGEVST